MIIGIENDFSDAEFAALGKLVWSFTVLEHELARAAMFLRYQVATFDKGESEVKIDDQVLKIAKGTLNGRFEAFISALKSAMPGPETEAWTLDASEKFKDGLRWRDRVCHGSWRRHEGKMTVRFFDRESLQNEVDILPVPVTVQELGELSETTLKWAVEIAMKSGTVAHE